MPIWDVKDVNYRAMPNKYVYVSRKQVLNKNIRGQASDF